MRRTLVLLTLSFCVCTLAYAQQDELTEEEKALVDRGFLPADYRGLIPPDSLGLNVYYSSDHAYRVRIFSQKGIVTKMDLPRGTLLNVQADQTLNPPQNDPKAIRKSFRGDIILRVRREDEWQPQTEGRASFAIMARSPLEMVLKDVSIEVEKVQEQED